MSRSTICRTGPGHRGAPKARTKSSSRRAAAPSARRCCRPPSLARPKTALADRTWRLLVGANLPAAERAALDAATRRHRRSNRRAPTSRTLLRNATLSISQAGYNTVVETLCCADRAVLVPFGTARETEQADRAALLAERGMVAVRAAGHAVARHAWPPPSAGPCAGPSFRSFPPCDVNGGPATAALLHQRAGCEQLAGPRRGGRALARGRPRPPSCGGATTMPPMPAPALDRLLDAASPNPGAAVARGRAGARHPGAGRSPGAPSRASTCCSTATPISTTPRPATRRCELGPHRPAMVVLGELGTGWLALERLFGSRGAAASWCRPGTASRPALVPTLPEIGFAGCRPSASAAALTRCRGLLQVNTHVDLIDWKEAAASSAKRRRLAALVAGAGACAYRHGRAGRPSQSSSCDGRAGRGIS